MANSNTGRTQRVGRQLVLSLAVGGVALMAASSAFAVSGNWTGAIDANFATGGNWDTGAAPGSTATTNSTDVATFPAGGLNTTVLVDANRNVGGVTFTTPGYTLTTGPLFLSSGGTVLATNGITGSGSTGVFSGISAPIAIQNVGGNGTFQSDAGGSSAYLNVTGAVTGVSTAGSTTTLTLTGVAASTNNFGGLISDGTAGGNLAVVKSGTGTWTIGASTYSGGTNVTAGTLRTGTSGNSNALFGTGAITLNGGTLRLGSTTGVTVNNALVVGPNGGTISIRTNETLAAPSITGTGVLTFTTEQVSLVVTPNTFNGFAGTINLTNTAAAGTNTGIRLATAFDNASATNLTFNLNANTSVARQNGTNGINAVGNTATIGGLSGTGGTFGGSAAGTGNFIYNIGNNGLSTQFSGVVANGGSLTSIGKLGIGALTLVGTNTYTGGTTINAGSIVTGNATALGVGGVNVAAGTLRVGNGTTNNLTLATSAFTTAQTVGGTALGQNALLIASGATLELAANTSNVALASGTYALAAGFFLDLNNLFNAAGTYTLITAAAGSTAATNAIGTPTFVDANTAAFNFAFAPDAAGNGVLTVTAAGTVIPEPASLAAVGLAGSLLLKRRRRA